MQRVFSSYENLKIYIGANGIYNTYADDMLRNHLECIGSGCGSFELEIDKNIYEVTILSSRDEKQFELYDIEKYNYAYILNINMNYIEHYQKVRLLKILVNKMGEVSYDIGKLIGNIMDTENYKNDLLTIKNDTIESIYEVAKSIFSLRDRLDLLLAEVKLYSTYKEREGEYLYIGSDNEYELNKKWATLQYNRIYDMLGAL